MVPRTTNRHGCVTLHSDHCAIEEGLPRAQVLLWGSGEQVRAMVDHVALAESRDRNEWRDYIGQDLRAGGYPIRVASMQRPLLPWTPWDAVVV
jgi:hypothetical protein